MLCNLVCDGTLFAFGTMKIHLQNHFKCSDMLILMVGSIPCGVYLLVGPIVSGLANRYGCRPIIIIGSIGAAACMAASTLSPNVWAMMIIYGVFGGVFFGMVYLPSVVMVSFYFDKKRAIANGLVTAGTGIGALSFGPLADFLMARLGWKTGMLIFAGIMLSCILFGAIMIPLKPVPVLIKDEGIELQSSVKTSKRSDKRTPPPPPYQDRTGDTTVPLLNGDEAGARTSNPATVPSDISPGASIASPIASPPSSHDQPIRVRSTSTSSRTSTVSGGQRGGVINPEDAARPLYKKDVFLGSAYKLNQRSRTSLHSNPYMASVTNIPQALDDLKKTEKQSTLKAFTDILGAMMDFSILKNKQMLLICIGNIFSMLGYYLPIMCLVSFAIDDMKVERSRASLLLTVFGLFNTIGRFACGPIAMIPHFGALRVHNILLLTAGILTILATYANSFFTAALYAGFCGFAIAPHMSLLPSVICDCVGLDRYTTAFGILFLFRGVTSIVGPPAAGFIKDRFQNYGLAFSIGGAMIAIAAFFHFAIVCVEPERLVEGVEGIDDEEEAAVNAKNRIDV